MDSKKGGLGKGLSALIEGAATDIMSSSNPSTGSQIAGSISEIPLAQIETNPFQPRTGFEKEALVNLTASIKTHGIIQPITLRKMSQNRYQIISGERRFRAATIAGLTAVPCYIRVANDQTMLEMAIVENVQREDTQEQLSDKVGKQRSTVSNYLRLLKLPLEIQAALRDNKISMGHARSLLSISNESEQLETLRSILADNLSVRKVEELVKNKTTSKKRSGSIELSRSEKKEVQLLSSSLETKVKVAMNNRGKGKIVIDFKNDSEFNRIMKLLNE